ncbi:HlyD family efflux transporter periplasmic adaptor subunit [Thermobrachium celere]|uniref:HlyD family efflux transporter periplasmic adaptor subunit n=1 Tax=Thermobrachium celere TaxID=53422 RepID=UPI0019453088|nr:HlyD family efflux transporter periplasmic adaptor subunit [Thermobrachium celere]GFR35027.1 hypothetical protein TCEA9_08390 [Thermobrachium celere]
MIKKQFLIKYVIVIAVLSAVLVSVLALHDGYKTVKIQKNVYEDRTYFEGIYFMNEIVLKTQTVENKKLKVENGDVVKKGKVIYEDIISPIQGKVLLYVDGNENKFKIENIKAIKKEDISNLKNIKVTEGIKVVDNSTWNLCIVANKDELKTLKKGGEIFVEVNSKQYACTIKDYFIKDENIFIVLTTKYDIPEFNLQRYFNGYIIKVRYYGFILPRDSVVDYEGKRGVFVKRGEYVYFTPININHMDYKICVTTDEILKDNDEVIINPKGLRDKQKIKR